MSLVYGLDKLRKSLRGFEDNYVLIGGTACSLLFEQYGNKEFRATDDLDIVIIAEGDLAEFGKAFWNFLDCGGYLNRYESSDDTKYYRFVLDKEQSAATGYPKQIELFARHPDFNLFPEAHLTPLPLDNAVKSLSAIILEEGYYEFLKSGIVSIEGVRIPDVLHIIPLKMRAHIDNNNLHDLGVDICERDLTKHRNDVIDLNGLLRPDSRLELHGQMRTDAELFFESLENFASKPELSLKIERKVLATVDDLKKVYL